jgi:SAM-dependent methyltransferase
MRQSGISRLSGLKLNRNAQDYIVMRYLTDELKETIPEFAKGNVLDIGCGNKPYEELFKGKVDSYTGCDVAQSDGNRVDIICSATELKFADERFDTVFSTQVMEHVDDPQKMLAETWRVLKQNGVLILSVPFCWELHEEPYDFYRYSKYGLTFMLQKEGFKIVAIKANGGKWAAICQLNLNMIYSTFRKKGVFRKVTKLLFHHLHFTALINRLVIWMDRKYHDELLTLNYVVVAIKKV